MKDFKIPEILTIEDVAEGVYVGSGSIIPGGSTPTPIIPDAPQCWINWQCRWDGHNSGGHSVCHISGTHCGTHTAHTLILHITTNFTIANVNHASGHLVSNVTANSFTITLNDCYNPGHNLGFCAEIVTSDLMLDEKGNQLHGAIGANNAARYYCTVADYSCS